MWSNAGWQSDDGGWYKNKAAGGGSVLAIDGSVHANASTTTVTTATLTATHANDYIIACIGSNAAADISTVKSGSGTSFTKLATAGPANNFINIWALFSTGIFSDTVVVTQSGAAFCTVDAFCVSGSGQTSLVFDSGGPQTLTGDPISITTVNPNTMVIAAFRESSAANPTAGGGFSQISGADFFLTEYQLLPSAGTLSCTQTTGAGTANGGIAIAIVHV
jgi:hypothetical protein